MEYLGRLKFSFLRIWKIVTKPIKSHYLYVVRQGSVLGPVLFTLFTTTLSAIISSFDNNHQLYADVTQMFMIVFISFNL